MELMQFAMAVVAAAAVEAISAAVPLVPGYDVMKRSKMKRMVIVIALGCAALLFFRAMVPSVAKWQRRKEEKLPEERPEE